MKSGFSVKLPIFHDFVDNFSSAGKEIFVDPFKVRYFTNEFISYSFLLVEISKAKKKNCKSKTESI